MQKSKLIISLFLSTMFLAIVAEGKAELRNGMSADVAIGQTDFSSNGINQGRGASYPLANTFYNPRAIFSDGQRVFIADRFNHRVLIYNSIPTQNNTSADVVIGQADFISGLKNQTNSDTPGANTLNQPCGVFSDGQKLFIADYGNRRVLIYNSIPTTNNVLADVVIGQPNFTSTSTSPVEANLTSGPNIVFFDGQRFFIGDYDNNRILIYNSVPTTNGASADLVIGQTDFSAKGINQERGTNNPLANTLNRPRGLFSDRQRLFIADNNNRVLIYNSIPTTNNASADVVIGQVNFTSTSKSPVGANSLNNPSGLFSDGQRLFIGDSNNRVLIYNSIPTTNNASADVVIGQADFTSTTTTSVRANTLNAPLGVCSDGKRLFIVDYNNHRVLIYNIGGSSIELGPQFEQGKAVLGKVFEDKNSNGIQDERERGIEGVKVASDTGIFAITDEDGKYHFPYIETGQRLLKIDPVTLPEGSTFTTDNPYKITVTKGILIKVSFGVRLPEGLNEPNEPSKPLLKVSITQDPVLLKPRLSVSATPDKDSLIFTIDCNYYLLIDRSELAFYDKNYKKLKIMPLPNPLPSKYILPLTDIPQGATCYQLLVFDKVKREDKTGMGAITSKIPVF